MRQIVLDTETTGLEVEQGHRIIEIGCVELSNRRLTGRVFHRYLNPQRDIDEGAQAVHGISRAQLENEPTFAQVQRELLEFLGEGELVIHNAPFDIAFLNAEWKRVEPGLARLESRHSVLDTLALARQMHPGQRNNLDALCKRYAIDNAHREYHGALLDARILAEVYLAMTGGQATLVLDAETDGAPGRERAASTPRAARGARIAVVRATEAELTAHEEALARLDGASGGQTVWRRL